MNMSVTVDRAAFLAALKVVVWGTPRRPAVNVLAGVVLAADAPALTLTTFDYEITTRSALAADVTGHGRVLVVARTLHDMVAGFKPPRRGQATPPGADVVTLTHLGESVTVGYGTARMLLETMPVEDYPTPPEPGPVVATVDAAALSATVAHVAKFATTNRDRPALMGVHLTGCDGRLRLVATDAYRIAEDTLPFIPVDAARPGILPALVPAATLAFVGKLFAKGHTAAAVAMTEDAGTVTFTSGGVMVSTRTLDGEFPKPDRFWPQPVQGTATVESIAVCTCGWKRYADSRAEAQQLARVHRATITNS